MTKIFCIVMLLAFCITDSYAQGRFRDLFRDRPAPPSVSALKIVGISSTCVGGIAGCLGLLYYGVTNSSGSDSNAGVSANNDGLIIAGVGGAMVVAGVIMIVASPRSHRNPWSVISPKRNELGVAFNFSR